MPTPSQAQHQALYLSVIAKIARAKALAGIFDKDNNLLEKPKYAIDPQWRVLVDVTWEEICEEIEKGDFDALQILPEALAEQVGHPVQKGVSVSVDIQDQMGKKLNALIESEDAANLMLHRSDVKMNEYLFTPKSRIIGLQQEVYFHAHLIERMVAKSIEEEALAQDHPLTDQEKTELYLHCKQAGDLAALQLNPMVQALKHAAMERASQKSSRGRVLNEKKFREHLNKGLDKARVEILPHIAKTVRDQLVMIRGTVLDENIVRRLTKNLAEATVASTNDYVHLDYGLGLVSFIGASERTAHQNALGKAHVADRLIYSHCLTDKTEVIPLNGRCHVRVPSLPLKHLNPITRKLLKEDIFPAPQNEAVLRYRIQKLKPNHTYTQKQVEAIVEEYQAVIKNVLKQRQIAQTSTLTKRRNFTKMTQNELKKAFQHITLHDTVDKIEHLQEKYQLDGHFNDERVPHAFVYNLYTSLNKGFLGMLDERRNQQTQSAVQILRAAHLYNRNNLNKKPFCLVQNMPVNGHGFHLGLSAQNPDWVNEATLMTHLASLHTVYPSLVEDEKEHCRQLFSLYEQFLKEGSTDDFFYQYLLKTKSESNPHTNLYTEEYGRLLSYFSSQPEISSSGSDLKQKLGYLLAGAFRSQIYCQHQYGFTYQALSVFNQMASLGGCKSGNERTQAVNGRVAILDFLNLPSESRQACIAQLHSEDERQTLSKMCLNFETALDDALGGNFLNGFAKVAEILDGLYERLNLEGHQSVISFLDQGGHSKLKPQGLWKAFDTNQCETVKIHSNKVKAWQAHNGLMKGVEEAFAGIKRMEGKKIIKWGLGVCLGSASLMALNAGLALLILGTSIFPGGPLIAVLGAAAVGMVIGLVATAFKAAYAKFQTGRYATRKRFLQIQQEQQDILRHSQPVKKSESALSVVEMKEDDVLNSSEGSGLAWDSPRRRSKGSVRENSTSEPSSDQRPSF